MTNGATVGGTLEGQATTLKGTLSSGTATGCAAVTNGATVGGTLVTATPPQGTEHGTTLARFGDRHVESDWQPPPVAFPTLETSAPPRCRPPATPLSVARWEYGNTTLKGTLSSGATPLALR